MQELMQELMQERLQERLRARLGGGMEATGEEAGEGGGVSTACFAAMSRPCTADPNLIWYSLPRPRAQLQQRR